MSQHFEESAMMNEYDDQLGALFASYRAACPDPEPGPDFMPRLWRRIEARRSLSLTLRRFAGGFVTAAAAICLAMAFYLAHPHAPDPVVYSSTYVDTLDAEHSPDTLAYLGLASFESSEGRDIR